MFGSLGEIRTIRAFVHRSRRENAGKMTYQIYEFYEFEAFAMNFTIGLRMHEKYEFAFGVKHAPNNQSVASAAR
jgi:hypothetical protein